MRTTRSEPAIVRAWSRVIALDGGTSNTRARLIQDGRIVASARRTVSVRDLVFWVGAVVADDAGHLARHPILARSPPVWMSGREPLPSLYAGWLAGLLEGPVTPLDDELSEATSALGALAVVLVSIDPWRQSDRSTVTEPAP
jgi:hypothetical protein